MAQQQWVHQRYRILEKIGEGGMAYVYLAEDESLGRQVALKIIRTEEIPPSQLERVFERFRREARNLARLTDVPGVVTLLDYGVEAEKPFLVMSHMPGGTLKERLGMPIHPEAAARMLLPIVEALSIVHEMEIIHRDIKPSNLLIDRFGKLALADFGIAKAFDTSEYTLTGTGLGVGTAAYMAPEQWRGQTTRQSDLYSLAVVFYEMVTGRKPFDAQTASDLFLKVMTEPLPDPRQYVSDLDDRAAAFLQRSLEKDPNQRYANAMETRDALQEMLAPEANPTASKPIETAVKQAAAVPVSYSLDDGETRDEYTELWQDRTPAVNVTPVLPNATLRHEPLIENLYQQQKASPNHDTDTYQSTADNETSTTDIAGGTRKAGNIWVTWVLLGIMVLVVLIITTTSVLVGMQRRNQAATQASIWQQTQKANATQTQAVVQRITRTAEYVRTATRKVEEAHTSTAQSKTDVVYEDFGEKITFGRNGVTNDTCQVSEQMNTISQEDLFNDPYLYFAAPFTSKEEGLSLHWTVSKGMEGEVIYDSSINLTKENYEDGCMWQGFALDFTEEPGEYWLVISSEENGVVIAIRQLFLEYTAVMPTPISHQPIGDFTFGLDWVESDTCGVATCTDTIPNQYLVDDGYVYIASPYAAEDIGKMIEYYLVDPEGDILYQGGEELSYQQDLCFWHGFYIDPSESKGEYNIYAFVDGELLFDYYFYLTN